MNRYKLHEPHPRPPLPRYYYTGQRLWFIGEHDITITLDGPATTIGSIIFNERWWEIKCDISVVDFLMKDSKSPRVCILREDYMEKYFVEFKS